MKFTAYISYCLVVVILATATFLAHFYGDTFSVKYIYGSAWFAVLLGVLTLSTLIILWQQKTYKKVATFGIHLSFVLILVGALFTRYTSQHGTIHLKYNQPQQTMMQEGTENDRHPKLIDLPFTVKLDTFLVTYYSGTLAPSDYISKIKIENEKPLYKGEVSMNNVLTYNGYRFYQASYDTNMRGTWLSVYRDKWGIPITYAGYFMLFASLLIWLFSARGNFRQLLKHPLLNKGLLIAVFLLIGTTTKAQSSSPKIITNEQLHLIGKIKVDYLSNPVAMEKIASDFTLKITGATKYKSYNAMQFFTGWIFYTDTWRDIPLFAIKNRQLKDKFNLPDIASWNDFYSGENGAYILKEYWNVMHQSGRKSGFMKEVEKLDEKIQLINMLTSGSLLRIFPIPDNDRVFWYAPNSKKLPDTTSEGLRLFVANAFNYIYTAVIYNDTEELTTWINKVTKYQQKYETNDKYAQLRAWANHIYITIPFNKILFMVCLTFGVLLLIITILSILKQKRWIVIERIGWTVFGIVFLISTLNLSVLGIASKRWPMTNGAETMMVLGWCIMLIAMLLRRKTPMILPFGFILAGFAQLVAFISMKTPEITPLMPVLASPLLSLHVSCMMISYALGAFTFLNAIAVLLIQTIVRNNKAYDTQIETLTVISRLLLYPLLAFMGIGIFVGAIWGNQSWGRYWGWDPKEVWALINFMVYAVAFHTTLLKPMRKITIFHIYMVFAFLTILMTYFGVNFFLGGMHSYA